MTGYPLFLVLQNHFHKYNSKFFPQAKFNNLISFCLLVRAYSTDKAHYATTKEAKQKAKDINQCLAELSSKLLSFFVSPVGEFCSYFRVSFAKSFVQDIMVILKSLIEIVMRRTGKLGNASTSNRGRVTKILFKVRDFAQHLLDFIRYMLDLKIFKADRIVTIEKIFTLPGDVLIPKILDVSKLGF